MLLAATVWGLLGPVQNIIEWDLQARSAWGMLFCILPILCMRWREIFRVRRPGLLAGITIAQAISLPTWLLSFGLTDVTRAITLVFLFPVLTALLDAAVNRRMPRVIEIGAALAAFGGVAIIGQDGFKSGGIRAGDVLAILSALSWSFVAVMQPKLNDARQGLLGLGLGGLLGCAVMFLFAYCGRSVTPPSQVDVVWTAGMGFAGSVAWFLFAAAAARITASMGGLLLYFEFAVTFLIGVVFLGERPSLTAYVGTGLILVAMLAGVIGNQAATPSTTRPEQAGA